MKNLSRYQLLIKNEQHKVRNVVGLCRNRCSAYNSVQDDLDLIRDTFYPTRERRRNKRRERITGTNVYRFEDQGIEANALGTSNRLVERSSNIDSVLKKYMRRDNFR